MRDFAWQPAIPLAQGRSSDVGCTAECQGTTKQWQSCAQIGSSQHHHNGSTSVRIG